MNIKDSVLFAQNTVPESQKNISSMMDNQMDFNTNHLQQISGTTERPSATNVTNHCFSAKTCEHPHFFINCPSFSMVLPPPNMGTLIPFSKRSAFPGLPKKIINLPKFSMVFPPKKMKNTMIQGAHPPTS